MTSAVFFDRDGVLVAGVERNGVAGSARSIKEFAIDSAASDAVRRVHDEGYLAVVITNQPDIARGLVSSQLIEHVPYDRSIFLEMNRVLRPGGTLVIGTPDYGRAAWRITEWLYKVLLPYAYGDDHITHYTRASLADELARTGFAVRRTAYVLAGELVMQCVKEADCAGP